MLGAFKQYGEKYNDHRPIIIICIYAKANILLSCRGTTHTKRRNHYIIEAPLSLSISRR